MHRMHRSIKVLFRRVMNTSGQFLPDESELRMILLCRAI